MVEDFADAREARDASEARLEEELESSNSRNVKRLETNLRLQEGLAEMTTELEMMAAQKHGAICLISHYLSLDSGKWYHKVSVPQSLSKCQNCQVS
jgi:hypothetical protein